MRRQSLGIIGAGVAGLTTAYILSRRHNVTLFEQNSYFGGHTNTIVIPAGPDAGTPVDTGFIVLNGRNYPTLLRLFEQLHVPLRNSDMTFGFSDENSGLQYSSAIPMGLLAQPGNLFRPSFLRMLADILKFNRVAARDLKAGKLRHLSLGDFLTQNRFSAYFQNQYLIPMGAAVWSTPTQKMFEFPAEAFVLFLQNHGLLTPLDLPQWKTVVGGSHQYVQKILQALGGKAWLNAGVRSVRRGKNEVIVKTNDGGELHFDHAVISTHADEALKLLSDPSPEEARLLGAWKYSTSQAILHTDSSVMPTNRHAWASWNYTREKNSVDSAPVSVTYYMNRLQGLKTEREYFVTLNRSGTIPDHFIIRQLTYTHPTYTFQSLATQKELTKLQGVQNTYFCGSYFGYGFHEDAVKSGIAVAKEFGLDL